MNEIAVWLRSLPPLVRWAVVGSASAGTIGAIVGLVIGITVFAPTAPFAAIEVGLPAAAAGGVLGFAGGAISAYRGKRTHP